MNIKNITFITQYFPPDFAPTGQFIEDMAVYLASQGYKVNVFTSKPGYAYTNKDCPKTELYSGINVTRTASVNILHQRIRGKVLSGLIFLLRTFAEIFLLKIKGDIVIYTTAPPFLIFSGWVNSVFLKKPYICVIYDIYPEVIVRLGVIKHNNWMIKIWKYFNHITLQNAEKVITLTEEMKNTLCADHPSLEKKIWIIPTWANENKIVPIAKSENHFVKSNCLESYFILMYSGNLGRCHDAQSILGMVKMLKRNTKIKFLLIGGGIGGRLFETEIKTNSLDNVTLLPYQEKEMLPFSLTACDVSILSLREQFEDIIAPSKFYGILAAGQGHFILISEAKVVKQPEHFLIACAIFLYPFFRNRLTAKFLAAAKLSGSLSLGILDLSSPKVTSRT